MKQRGCNHESDRRAVPQAGSLEAALAALAAAPPAPLSEDFIRRVMADAHWETVKRAAAARPPTPLRGDTRVQRRAGPRGVGPGVMAGLGAIAACALLGFFAGWTDQAGIGAQGLADADLLADRTMLASHWEETL